MKQAAIIAFSILLIAFNSSIQAQKLVACETYDSSGKANNVYTTWDIKAAGSYIYLHYSQPTVLGAGAWTLTIEKDSAGTGKFFAYKKSILKPRKGKNWIVADELFKGEGKYKCTVKQNGQIKATSTLTVEIAIEPDSEEDAYNADYYDESNIIFCKTVDSKGNTTGNAASFSLAGAKQITLSVYIENNGKAFKTRKVYATVYKGLTKVKEYNLDIEVEWNYFSFKHNFTEAGDYTVEFYNGNDVFMNTGSVKITK